MQLRDPGDAGAMTMCGYNWTFKSSWFFQCPAGICNIQKIVAIQEASESCTTVWTIEHFDGDDWTLLGHAVRPTIQILLTDLAMTIDPELLTRLRLKPASQSVHDDWNWFRWFVNVTSERYTRMPTL